MRKVKVGRWALLLLIALLLTSAQAYSAAAPSRKARPDKSRVSHRQPARRAQCARQRAGRSRQLGLHHATAHLAAGSRKPGRPGGRVAGPVYTVTATTYHALSAQTDSQPFVTADNSTIRRGYGSRQRWLAVSRDLLKQGGGRIHYGDRVRVRGVSPKLDGIYTVHDTMHRRHQHHIDILSNPREKLALSARHVTLQLTGTPTRKQPAGKSRLAANTGKHERKPATRPAHARARRASYLVAAMR